MESLKLNPVQKAAFSLIQHDLRYIYTVMNKLEVVLRCGVRTMTKYMNF